MAISRQNSSIEKPYGEIKKIINVRLPEVEEKLKFNNANTEKDGLQFLGIRQKKSLCSDLTDLHAGVEPLRMRRPQPSYSLGRFNRTVEIHKLFGTSPLARRDGRRRAEHQPRMKFLNAYQTGKTLLPSTIV